LILRAAALLGGGLSARHVLTRMVHGVDTSELALATCRARLGLLALAHGGRADDADDAPLARGNSLVDDGQFAWKKSFPGVFARGGFDLAIGNPPYLRDSRKKDMPADLASRYRAATSHYDLYTLFMERSLEVVREGGRICLLTSNRYLVQKYGEGIRRLLLEHELEEVTDLDFRTFEAGVTTCITTARKAAPGPRATARLARVTAEEALPARHAPPGDVPQAVAAKVPLSWLRGLERAAFRIGLDPARVALAERLAEGAARFSDLGFVTLGMVFHDPREGGARKADYLSHERRPPFDAPLVDGEHVERWRFNGKLWLRYAPDEHREPRFPELFASPKLVCRRIIGRARIMACVDEGGTYFSDNTVGFVPYHALRDCSARAVRARANKAARGSGFDLYYLAALLNSRLLTWYYRTMLGFGVHFYPAHLKALPAREADAPTARALAALAREASRARDTRDLDREIDRLVERLYEVTPRESALIGGG
ncbi:MAG: hypothetical protein FJX76_26480, partial [Armatimonadetes bacterium]|nr:hypothetical protein [Armatimonadota bacterium]